MTNFEETIKKKVQGVVDTPDALDSEKMQQLKKLYQKAKQGSGRSKEVQYVVAKKGIGKRVSRPLGVSGHFKVVDPRMKKDSQKQNTKINSRERETNTNNELTVTQHYISWKPVFQHVDMSCMTS